MTGLNKFLIQQTTDQKNFRFEDLPSRQNKHWFYTNLQPIKEISWSLSSLTEDPPSPQQKELVSFASPLGRFFNGQWIKPPSTKPAPSALWNHQLIPTKDANLFSLDNYFENINHQLCKVVFDFKVPPGINIDKPIYFDFFHQNKEPLLTNPRLRISVGEGSKLQILLHTSGEGVYFCNSSLEIELEKNSSLELINLQRNSPSAYSFSHLQFRLKKGASLKNFNLSLGGKLNRETLLVQHLEEESSSQIYGAYLTRQNHQSDHYTNIEHLAERGYSTQLYKGLLMDSSRSVFNGRVYMSPKATESSSSQLNNHLLLNPQAEVNSRPYLEILVDDVKATHGTTVGQPNEEEIFYLQSRGIPHQQALEILAQGFLMEIFGFIENPSLVSWIKSEVNL